MGLLTTPRPPEGPPDPFWTSGTPLTDPSWNFGSASEPLSDLREGIPTLPRPLGGSFNITHLSKIASRLLPALWEDLSTLLKGILILREDLPIPHGPLGVPTDSFRASGWASRPLADLRVELPTTPGPSESLPTPPGPPGEPSDLIRTCETTSRALLDLRDSLPNLLDCLLTPPELSGGTPDTTQPSVMAS